MTAPDICKGCQVAPAVEDELCAPCLADAIEAEGYPVIESELPGMLEFADFIDTRDEYVRREDVKL